MKSASIPDNEPDRLAALRRYAVLDTAAEEEFDDCARLAAQLCGTPAALISLVDADRQWFKSRIGIELEETSRAISFCGHTILGTAIFVVPDALCDERFRDNPLVQGGPRVRFYAAAPLITPDGFCIGALCVIDHSPRQLAAAQLEALTMLGRQVVCQLELRSRKRAEAVAMPAERTRGTGSSRSPRPARGGEPQFRRILEGLPEIIWTSRPTGGPTYLNPRWVEYTGLSGGSREELRKVIHPEDYDRVYKVWEAAVRARTTYTAELRMKPAGGSEYRWFLARAVPGAGSGEWYGTATDIHDIKLAKGALRESEERFRVIAELTSDAIRDWDLGANRLVWSPGLTELFGYPITGSATDPAWWFERIHSDDRLRVESSLFNVSRGQSDHWEGTYRFRCADGSYAEVCDRARVMRGADGQVARILGAMQDHSKRRRVEANLRASEQRYARAVCGTSDGLWDWNILTGEADLSPRWKELLGFADDELPNHESSFFSRIHSEDLPRVRAALQAHFEQQAPWDIELRLCTRNGDYRWYRSRGQAERNEQGQALHLTGALSDITEYKYTEQALRLRDRAIMAMSQGVLITDATQPDNPIIYVSPAFERLTGYSASEILLRNCRFLQGKDTDPATVVTLREAIANQRACSVEILNYRKDQTPFWNALTIAPIKDGDRVTHFVGVQTDVTVRRKLEAQLRQAQKMEAIGRLAGGIAHDFNNLLTIINGYSDMLLSELTPKLPQRSQLAEIREAGRRAAGLTAQLLALSRKTMVKPKVLDLNSVIESRAQMFGRMFAGDISVELSLSPKLSLIKADPGQLEQVIINLVLNARDAMAKGGRLTIATTDIRLLSQDIFTYPDCPPGRYVQLTVTDTGCGMSDEVKAKLFEPFFTTKEPGKGTGLGLATVYGIVQQASGYISVQSQVNQGTTITVLFPVVSAPQLRPAPDPAALPRGGAETILLVDDEDAVRKLARIVLKAQGYLVLEAGSGADALRMSDNHKGPIHLLLTDVVMPMLSGRELAAALRTRRPELKVMYMSGYTDDSILRNRVSDATSCFLPKPFAPLELVKKVRAVLDESAPPAPPR